MSNYSDGYEMFDLVEAKVSGTWCKAIFIKETENGFQLRLPESIVPQAIMEFPMDNVRPYHSNSAQRGALD